MTTTATKTASTAASTATTTRTRRRSTNVALWVLQVLLAATFALGGVNKLIGEAQTVAGFEQIGWGTWFMYLIGALEVAGAIALLIPILSGLAGLAFLGLMTGAVIMQATAFDGEMVAVPAVVGVLVAVVAWARRDRTAQLATLVGLRR